MVLDVSEIKVGANAAQLTNVKAIVAGPRE